MTFQPVLIEGGRVDRIPAPRQSLRHLMLATATAVQEQVDTDPGRIDPLLDGCFVLRQSGLVLAATGCRRPLLLREFSQVCEATGRNGLIVRKSVDVDPAKTSYDIKFAGANTMLCAHRLWLADRGAGSAWLIPTVGEGPYVRFGTDGVNVHERAPFEDDWQRHVGLLHGSSLMWIAAKGWF